MSREIPRFFPVLRSCFNPGSSAPTLVLATAPGLHERFQQPIRPQGGLNRMPERTLPDAAKIPEQFAARVESSRFPTWPP
jgi:hypothetical protein